MIADPPSDPGALQETVAWASPAVAATEVGAPGAVAGVTAAEADEAAEVPAELVAVTVKVWPVPLARPVIVHVVAGAAAVQVAPPGEAVAV